MPEMLKYGSALRSRIAPKAKQIGAALFVGLAPVAAFAQTTTEGDVSDATAKVALWLAGAVTLSIAFTAARSSIKASKLPRSA